jgi:hypothetical protein
VHHYKPSDFLSTLEHVNMRFVTALSLATLVLGIAAEPTAAVSASASTIGALATITGVLAEVSSETSLLAAAVNAFPGDTTTINNDNADLLSIIEAGIITVQGAGNLSLNDAIALLTPSMALQNQSAILINDLIAKTSLFEAAGLCQTTESQLTEISAASEDLINAVVAATPPEVQAISGLIITGFQEAFQNGTEAFGTGNCTDVSASSSTTAASSPTTGASSAIASTSSSAGAPIGGTSTSPSTTGTVTSAIASSAEAITMATSSAAVQFTGAADVNRATNTFGILALAAVALIF